MIVKTLAPFPLFLSALAAARTVKEEETKMMFDKYLENWKQRATSPHLYENFLSDGAVLSVNGGEPAPVREVIDPMNARIVKYENVFDYHFVTDTHVGGRCHDYIEFDNGCSGMFEVDNIATVKDGKIVKMESFMDSETEAKFNKCMPGLLGEGKPDMDVPAPAARNIKEEEIKVIFDEYLNRWKQRATHPHLYKECLSEDAFGITNGGEPFPIRDMIDPMNARIVKYENVFDYHFITNTHVGGRCHDYIEFDNGCSEMFQVDSIVTVKDGKIVEMEAFVDSENEAKFNKCMPGLLGEKKPTEDLA